MVFKTYLLVLWLEAIGIQCKLFCDSPVIESAITIKDSTYLFKDNDYWIWNHTTNHIAPESKPINQTFTAQYKEQGETEWHRLNQIDAIFSTVMLKTNRDVDPSRGLLYIFQKNEYYFLVIGNCGDIGMCFPMLSPGDRISIPEAWNYYGGILSDWFPNKIKAVFQYENNVILFHMKYARFVSNPRGNHSWPPNDQKIDMSFDQFIDDIFEIPFTEDLVMTVGTDFCRFNKNQLNVTPNELEKLEIRCDWKPNKYLFLCENESNSTPSPMTTTAPIIESTLSVGTELEGQQTKVSAIDSVSEESSVSVTELDTSEEMVENNENNLWILFFILLFLVLIFVIIASIIGIAYCLTKKQTKYGTGGKTGTSIRMGQSSSNSVDSASMATIVTVDTLTGEAHNSNS